METTSVEERLTRIEREFDDLKHEVLGLKPRAKAWRQTVGAIPDDDLSRSARKLGCEWRDQANASPVLLDGALYLRTEKHLWKITGE